MSYNVEIPFPADHARLNSVQPAPELGADGAWRIVVYAKLPGESEYTQRVYRWKPGSVAALEPLQTATNARGSIGVHAHGAALFSWQGSGMYPKLVCQSLDFVPAEPTGVAEMRARVEGIEQSAGLSADDRAALDALKRMLGAVRG